MTPERERELAAEYGLDKAPELRYDDVPEGNVPFNTGGLVLFHKTLALVDSLRTAAFQHYLSDKCVIDQTMDARSWSRQYSFSTMVRTDVPPPVNERITRATGIRPTLDDRDYFIWLRDKVSEFWTILGAKKMAPPLIYCGGDHWRRWSKKERIAGAKPFMGVIMKFDWTPGVYGAEYGVIVPSGQKIDDAHKVVLTSDS